MCVAYIFTKLWTGKFFGFLAPYSYTSPFYIYTCTCTRGTDDEHEQQAQLAFGALSNFDLDRL